MTTVKKLHEEAKCMRSLYLLKMPYLIWHLAWNIGISKLHMKKQSTCHLLYFEYFMMWIPQECKLTTPFCKKILHSRGAHIIRYFRIINDIWPFHLLNLAARSNISDEESSHAFFDYYQCHLTFGIAVENTLSLQMKFNTTYPK